jgi:hypothetical protein
MPFGKADPTSHPPLVTYAPAEFCFPATDLSPIRSTPASDAFSTTTGQALRLDAQESAWRTDRGPLLLVLLLVDFSPDEAFVQYFQGGSGGPSPGSYCAVTEVRPIRRSATAHATHAAGSSHEQEHHDHHGETKERKDPEESGPCRIAPRRHWIDLRHGENRRRIGERKRDRIQARWSALHCVHRLFLQ